MANQSLDPVIRLIEPNSVIPASGQKIVLIDVKRRAVVATRPWFGVVRDSLIGNSSDAGHVGAGTLPGFQVRDVEYAVEVSLKFDVSCPPGNEERVALALFDPDELPTVVLQRHLGKWLRELSRHDVQGFVDRYFAGRSDLENELVTRAREQLGLDMNVRLVLDAERTLNRIDVEDDRLVTVSDFDDEEQYLKFRVGVEVDPENRGVAILQCKRYSEIHTLVPEEIERFIRRNVTMQMFCTELNTAVVRQPLIRHLNEVLRPFGRKVGTLTLEAELSGPELQFHLQDDVDVSCRLHQYPRPVKISNKVQMNLVDPARYRAAKSPPLQAWLRQNLERFVPELLFEARYIDVLLRFDPFEARIKETLRERAAKIGYELKQFITVPDLEPIRWKDPFAIEVEGQFPTQRSDVPAKLYLVAVVRIPLLERIKEILNRDQHVPTLMQKSILERVGQYLHNITPERYFMRFDFTDRPGEVTVETAIREAITQELTARYHAEVISVAVKPVETEPMTRLRELQQQICDLVVKVETLHANAPIVFTGKFHVEAVDQLTPESESWSIFQTRRATLAEIRQHLEGHLRAELQTRPLDELLFRTPYEQQVLSQRLQQSAARYARDQFGLAISVDSISRETTIPERLAIQDDADVVEARLTIARADRDRTIRVYGLVNDELEAQLLKLLQERTRLTGVEGSDDEIAALDVKIAKARARIAKAALPSMAALKAEILPEGNGNRRLAPAPPKVLTGVVLDPPPQQRAGEEAE